MHHFKNLFLHRGHALTLNNNVLPALSVSPHFGKINDGFMSYIELDLGICCGYAVLCHRSSSAAQPYTPNPNCSDHFPTSCIRSRQYTLCLGRYLTAGQHSRHHMCLGQAPILMPTRRSLHIKDSAIHVRVNLSRPRAVLPVQHSSRLCCTDPWPCQPSQPEATEEPAGSFHAILATTLSVLTFT